MKIQVHQRMQGRMATRWREERGFTIIELLAALVVALVIVGAGFTALTTSDKASRVNDLVAATQQNVRIAMELLSRDVKAAGFGMMSGAVGACANAINPLDNTAGGPDTGPDTVDLVVPTTSIVAPVWTLGADVAGGPATNAIPINSVASGGTTAIAEMTTAGLGVGSTVSIAGAASGTVAAVAGNNIQLVNPLPAPSFYPAGTQVYLLQCIRYQVSNVAATCGGNAPCLLRGVSGGALVPIADGIEDLQLTYACDGCNAAVNGGVADGLPDDQNGSNSFDIADFISNSTWATAPLVPATIRLVQISIVARQLRNDQGLGEGSGVAVSTGAPVVVGDHDPANDAGFNLATYQQMRRRILIRTVDARNLGL